MVSELMVNLYVADMDRALGFYAGLLGGAETFRFPAQGQPEHVELRLGGALLALSSEAGLVSHGLPAATRGQPFELVIKVDDVDATVDQLRAHGVVMFRDAFDSPAGNRVAYVFDPDGNRIQLWAPRGA